MGFDIKIDQLGNICIVKVYGYVDISVTPRLDACFSEIIGNGKTKIVVDFENCHYIDSECVKTLIKAYISIKEKGSIIICGANGPVLRILKVLGLNALFQIIPSIDYLVPL